VCIESNADVEMAEETLKLKSVSKHKTLDGYFKSVSEGGLPNSSLSNNPVEKEK
jgi:hypothetical protein